MDLHATPVAEGGGGGHHIDPGGNTPERGSEDLTLGPELLIARKMLPLTPAALAEVRARRRDPSDTRLDDTDDLGTRPAPMLLRYFHLHEISGRPEWHEDHASVGTPDGVPSVGHRVEAKL